ncbi:hypothetical protein ACHAXA_011692 [Cyclostephanos tholiformis]|uniref:Uncharacterized protein n=1 Tax=Cyclostephanos tholiformis TaxID=382380 RepID=A0ABD3SCG7_9STRA
MSNPLWGVIVIGAGTPRARISVVWIQDQDKSRTDSPFSANFDPSSMNAARRAAVRKIKLDEEVAAAVEEARLLKSFRALPLPGGVEVKNNIFASTLAFQGKQVGPADKLVRRSAKCEMNHSDESSALLGTFGECDALSMVPLRTWHECSSEFVLGNEEDREMERQLLVKRELKKRQLLDSINQIVWDEMQPVLMEKD